MSKTDPSNESFYTVPDMRLDFCDGRTVWYSESKFLRDSLKHLAFNESGNIVNQEIYAQMVRMNSLSLDATTVDLSSHTFMQHYAHGTMVLNGLGNLALPQWETSGKERDYRGYRCHEATAFYLGRQWTIWYCEDLPFQVGPWLLWGAPGLIVEARDSDNLFIFELEGMEMMSESNFRFEQVRAFYVEPRNKHRRNRHIIDDLRTIELTNAKMRTDTGFYSQMKNHSSKPPRMVDSDGNEMDVSRFFQYIPLIPTDYWK